MTDEEYFEMDLLIREALHLQSVGEHLEKVSTDDGADSSFRFLTVEFLKRIRECWERVEKNSELKEAV